MKFKVEMGTHFSGISAITAKGDQLTRDNTRSIHNSRRKGIHIRTRSVSRSRSIDVDMHVNRRPTVVSTELEPVMHLGPDRVDNAVEGGHKRAHFGCHEVLPEVPPLPAVTGGQERVLPLHRAEHRESHGDGDHIMRNPICIQIWVSRGFEMASPSARHHIAGAIS